MRVRPSEDRARPSETESGPVRTESGSSEDTVRPLKTESGRKEDRVRLCEDRENGPGQSSKKTRALTDSVVWGVF